MELKINQRVCTRCGGSGEYSYNLKDGTRCYGCGGTGKQIVTPKGQKKIKPTAELKNCKVGDIIDMDCILCQVTSVKWIKLNRANSNLYNQVVRYTRLVNGEKMKTWRSATVTFVIDANPYINGDKIDWKALDLHVECFREMYPGGTYSVNHRDNTAVYRAAIDPSEDMIGTEVTE